MFFRLLLLFTLVPFLELWVLLELGRHVGFVPTLALVIGTGILGAWHARHQGLRTLRRVEREWQAGKVPTEALLDGLLILIAGAFLLTPGLLTDLAGFALLTPLGRRAVRRAVAARFRRHAAQRPPRVIELDDWEVKSPPPIKGDPPP